MNLDHVKEIAAAVLYEGYILYPYRASSIKNRQRWSFGGIFPAAYAASGDGDPSSMQTQCLVRGTPGSVIDARVRFLHLVARQIGQLQNPIEHRSCDATPVFTNIPAMELDKLAVLPGEEAIEREVASMPVTLADLAEAPVRREFAFPGKTEFEPLGKGGAIAAHLVRTSLTIEGALFLCAEPIAADVWRLTVRIENTTTLATDDLSRGQAQRYAFASTHTILAVSEGSFVSLLDPPEELMEAAQHCENQGTWPVLAGEEGTTDTLLSSPIILYDYPKIAPESPGDLFDSTEIDEILTLRILALTDEEKREMAAGDERARALLRRTESLTPADLYKLHGVLRNPRAASAGGSPLPKAPSGGSIEASSSTARLNVGDQVRLHPKAGGDIMDLALKDKLAIIEAIERDFEDRIHVAVTLIDDPGRDLGLGRFPGHRFFFSPEEVEPFGDGAGS